MRAPGSCCLLAVLLAATSCSDDRVRIELALPAAYEAAVRTAQITVLLAPPDGTMTCDALAFGELDDAVVRASVERELVITRSAEPPELDVARAGDKLVVVRGLGADGQLVVQGCASVGPLRGGVRVAVMAEPTTVIALPPPQEIYEDLGFAGALLLPQTAVVKDAFGATLAGAAVRVRTVAGRVASDALVYADAEGQVVIDTDLGGHRGPYVVDVRARWQRQGAAPLAGFAPAALLAQSAVGVTLFDAKPLRAPSNTGHVVAALLEAGGGRELQLMHLAANPDPSGLPFLFVGDAATPVTGAQAFGVVESQGGESAVVLAEDPSCGGGCWTALGADAQIAKVPTQLPSTSAMTALLPTAPCTASRFAGPFVARFA
ncbi:MAG TPA: hypothetical protein VLC93_09710, partial [Myxococcota bacterium]|nr:hypothetical protein [Myxococcota bacterium]